MRNTQYAAGATAGMLNTQIERKIRRKKIRNVNRITPLSFGLARRATTSAPQAASAQRRTESLRTPEGDRFVGSLN